MTGEPILSGSLHLMVTAVPLNSVVGASGFDGTSAV